MRQHAARKPELEHELLRDQVERRIHANLRRAAPGRIQRALALLAGGGGEQVHRVAGALGLSERSLHRELVHWAGLPPKALARIFRMQAAMRHLRAGRMRLPAIALEAGYADQPHMTRELRRLTGLTPSALRGA